MIPRTHLLALLPLVRAWPFLSKHFELKVISHLISVFFILANAYLYTDPIFKQHLWAGVSSPVHSSSQSTCSTEWAAEQCCSSSHLEWVSPLLAHWSKVREGDEEIQPMLGWVWGGRRQHRQSSRWGHQLSVKHSLLTLSLLQRASCLFPVWPPPERSLWVTWTWHHSDTSVPFLLALRGTVPLVRQSLKYRDRLWILI